MKYPVIAGAVLLRGKRAISLLAYSGRFPHPFSWGEAKLFCNMADKLDMTFNATCNPVTAVADVPRAKTVVQHLKDTTGFSAACARIRPQRPVGKLLRLSLPKRLVTELRKAARNAIERHGLHGWLSREGRAVGSNYESLSLTYNPDLSDPGIHDVHQSTLGSSVNPGDEFFYGQMQRFKSLKNTYFDTYGFRLLTPAARIGALGEFLAECRLTLVRSRLSVLYGDDADQTGFETGWHRDEPVFENLRINIPLVTHRSYKLQVEHILDKPDRRSATMTEHHLSTGYAYTLDTNRPHRVYSSSPCRLMRVHLVLGFSPWFRYDSSKDAWMANEFFGRLHPFDIVRKGGLHPAFYCP
jgi:hypothetical protein